MKNIFLLCLYLVFLCSCIGQDQHTAPKNVSSPVTITAADWQSDLKWDSFAEANWKANKIERAVEYYNKAIELDPNGVTGDNSRRMLEQIKKAKPF